MSAGRNLILLGQAEEVPVLPVLPAVQAMLASEGFYVGGDTRRPELNVPLVSVDGKVFSMEVDEELAPNRFLATLTLQGPYRVDRPQSHGLPAGCTVAAMELALGIADRASRVDIECHCHRVLSEGDDAYYDLDSAKNHPVSDGDVQAAEHYLLERGLIERHAAFPHLVRFVDQAPVAGGEG